MNYPQNYYCPTCREFFDHAGASEGCVHCGETYPNGCPEETCPACGSEEFEMSCPECGRHGDEQGLDHAECWAKDIARQHPKFT